MIDHISLTVADVAVSKKFYDAALAPLGFVEVAANENFVMYRHADGSVFGVSKGIAAPIHFAFGAPTHDAVKEFYDAALAFGGTDNGAPGIREKYAPTYYAAFVIDPDGYRIEAVCHAK